MVRPLVISVLLGSTLAAQPVLAQSADSLDGRWRLDAKASSSLDPILKALSYGWLSRRIMRSLSVDQVIRSTPAGLALRVLTRFSDDTIVLPTDNRWAPGRTLDGGETLRRSRWLAPAVKLRTEDRFASGLLVTTRKLVGSDTFHEALEFQVQGKSTLKATRVFRRR